MKGIIVDFFEDKGFGFIKDENQQKRFFHISNVKDKIHFLANLEYYYYTDWIERKCYVINFNPSENAKGINAINIELTDQIFNDKTVMEQFPAIVTDVRYYKQSLTRTVSGIKSRVSTPYGATRGGNGTYRLGYPETMKELNIDFRRIGDIGWKTVDVRTQALQINNRKSVTDKFVSDLKNKILNKTITILSSGKTWQVLEPNNLKI